MGCETKIWLMLVFVLIASTKEEHFVYGKPKVPCYFIFGDSLSDSGNNNDLLTSARVNYYPYGIDFPNGPTGRFSNGRTAVDFISEFLGFDNYIPPYSTARGLDIIKGVNYASGGSGISDETGNHLGSHISLGLQMKNHKDTVSHIVQTLGNSYLAKRHLKKCLYSVGIGSNDYINNYFLPESYKSSRHHTPEQYASSLIMLLNVQLRILYNTGARKVVLNGLGMIGCAPNSMAMHGKHGLSCVENMNTAVMIFNDKLKLLIDELNTELTQAKFIYINTTSFSSGNPLASGFKVFNVGCCPVESNGQCIRGKPPCKNRNEYIFWDSFHFTETMNNITATRSYNAVNPTDAYPMDISHLVQL